LARDARILLNEDIYLIPEIADGSAASGQQIE
jgi:hypothetical protein